MSNLSQLSLPSGQVKTVLVVDDDAVNRIILEELLSQSGYKILLAENGAQAVQVFAQQKIDVVLMDIMMPIMDGYEAALKIKQLSAGHYVPIIFLTAITDEDDLARCVSCGGDDFLTKPFSRTILLAKMQAFTRMADLYQTITTQRDQIETHHEQMMHEQKAAKKIYSRMINQGCLDLPNLRYILSPLSIFNGDILLVASTPSGSLNILLGDATGHGLPAAISTVPVSDVFYSLSKTGASLEEIVLTINKKLRAILTPEFFVCASVINISSDFGVMSVWHGGLPEIIIYSEKQSRVKTTISSTNLPLGVVDNNELSTRLENVKLEQGDRIFVYSDGLIEARNKAREEYGAERLLDVFSRALPAEVVLDHICKEVYHFRDSEGQSDDISILEINADASIATHGKNDNEEDRSVYYPGDWSIEFQLSAQDLKTTNPLAVVTQHVNGIAGIARCREKIFVILSELYNNALDHGILLLDSKIKDKPEGFSRYFALRSERLAELESGHLTITIKNKTGDNHIGGCVHVRIEDSGTGFDYQKYNNPLETNQSFSGRGLSLVRALCNEVNYEGKGNIVSVVVEC